MSGASTAASGDIALTAPDIEIGQGARLLAQGTGVFRGGKVTLSAAQTANPNWFLGIQNFRIAQASTSIDIGPDSVIEGSDLIFTASATTSPATSGSGSSAAPAVGWSPSCSPQ